MYLGDFLNNRIDSEDEDETAAEAQNSCKKSFAEAVYGSVSSKSDYRILNAPGRGMPKKYQHFMPQPPVTSFIPEYIREIDGETLVRDLNPSEFCNPHEDSRFFVIKSYSEEDVHKAIKYSIWSSSKENNKILNEAFESISNNISEDMETLEKVPAILKDQPMVYLFFSVNGSGNFCGVARMASVFHEEKDAKVWCHKKWSGLFYVRWLYVKDVSNPHLRHIRLPPNELGQIKPVTISRDGTEVLGEVNGEMNGVRVLKVIHHYKYTTTLFDDYDHYDRLEKEKYQRLQRL